MNPTAVNNVSQHQVYFCVTSVLTPAQLSVEKHWDASLSQSSCNCLSPPYWENCMSALITSLMPQLLQNLACALTCSQTLVQSHSVDPAICCQAIFQISS